MTTNMSPKRVHFAEPLTTIVELDECDDTRQARKGPWMMVAMDRARFKKRIAETEIILDPILKSKWCKVDRRHLPI